MLTWFPRHLVVRSLHFLSGLMHLSHTLGLPAEAALVTDEEPQLGRAGETISQVLLESTAAQPGSPDTLTCTFMGLLCCEQLAQQGL